MAKTKRTENERMIENQNENGEHETGRNATQGEKMQQHFLEPGPSKQNIEFWGAEGLVSDRGCAAALTVLRTHCELQLIFRHRYVFSHLLRACLRALTV